MKNTLKLPKGTETCTVPDYQLEVWQCCCEMVYQKDDGIWVFGIERTSYWDDDGYTEVDYYQEEYHIHYCPFCGKQLVQEDIEDK